MAGGGRTQQHGQSADEVATTEAVAAFWREFDLDGRRSKLDEVWVAGVE